MVRETSLLRYVVDYLSEEHKRRTVQEERQVSEYGIRYLVEQAIEAYKGGAR